MTISTRQRLLHGAPRVLGLLYALLLSLFAFDSWEGVASFGEGLAVFIIHLTPVYLVLFALIVGLKWPRPGGLLFLVLAAGFTAFFGWRDAYTLLLLAAPPALIGVLFLLDGRGSRATLAV